MNDLISKVTFGFVMSQLFPGAIAVFALGFAYVNFEGGHPDAVLAAAAQLLTTWGKSEVMQRLFLVGLSIGAGMLIHGLHWAVLGALETTRKFSVFDNRFHKRRIFVQIVLAPVRVVEEIGYFCLIPKSTRGARMEDNVARIHKDVMDQYQWVEEFYLYSAQFFAHTAYAIIAVFLSVLYFVACHGITARRAWLLVGLYLLAGVLFTLGRVQFASMFYAEDLLAQQSGPLFAKDVQPSSGHQP